MAVEPTGLPALQPPDERTALEERLDYERSLVLSRTSGLDSSGAKAFPLEATALSVGGIIKHLAWAEDRWFQNKLLGRPMPAPWRAIPDDSEWAFISAVDDDIDDLIALYLDACNRSREAASGLDRLDAVAALSSFGVGPVNLRWILVHMIDETAQHVGHIDLLCDALGHHGKHN
jgi:hypothetical protein